MKYEYRKASEYADKFEIVLSNERGEREWLYIVSHCEARWGPTCGIWVHNAIQLLGNRKRYPLNFARLLKIELPEEGKLPLLEGAQNARRASNQNNVDQLKRMLGKR